MTRVFFLLCALAATSGCEISDNARVTSRVISCWKGATHRYRNFAVEKAEIIILIRNAVIIPSTKCPGLRLQAKQISASTERALTQIEYREEGDVLGFQGKISFRANLTNNPKVIEIELLSIRLDQRLSTKRVEYLINSVRNEIH